MKTKLLILGLFTLPFVSYGYLSAVMPEIPVQSSVVTEMGDLTLASGITEDFELQPAVGYGFYQMTVNPQAGAH